MAFMDWFKRMLQPPRYHTVVTGETLSGIAKDYYGDVQAFNKIFNANRDLLSDPNKIKPGQKLRIPWE